MLPTIQIFHSLSDLYKRIFQLKDEGFKSTPATIEVNGVVCNGFNLSNGKIETNIVLNASLYEAQ